MSLNRTTRWMAALAGVFLMALPASGQGLQDAQVFAPANISNYGGGVRPNEGFFFAFDYLFWNVSAPDGSPIGFPSNGRQVYYGPYQNDMSIQTNTMTTEALTIQRAQGERFEIGDRWRHHGWMVGTLSLHAASQEITTSNVNMVWDDPPFGPNNRNLLEGYYQYIGAAPSDVSPDDIFDIVDDDGEVLASVVYRDLPVTFDDFTIKQRTDVWGVELLYSYRTHPGKHGGFLEFYAGARYLEVNDLFAVDARNDVVTPDADDDEPIDWTNEIGATLADSSWDTDAENHIIGPQVAIRWHRTSARWTLDASGRFVAGFNRQNIYQKGTLGTRLEPGRLSFEDEADIPLNHGRPLNMSPTSFSHSEHANEWSPIVELRLNLQYQLTRGISVRGGWSGMWVDGIARASELNVYHVPDMGINMANNREDLFVHGFNCGVLLNY